MDIDNSNDDDGDNRSKRPVCHLQPRFTQDESDYRRRNRSRCAQTGTLLHVAAQQV